MNKLEVFLQLSLLGKISTIILYLCTISIFSAIAYDFNSFGGGRKAKKEKKSIVETGSMVGFFLLFYLLVKYNIWRIDLPQFLTTPLIILGLILVIVGTIVNIWGRINLGSNWSNQIKIYDNHKFIHHGAYNIVRHPLYASLVWIFIGSSLIFHNLSSLILNVFIFIPFMYFRANQEDVLLSSQFKTYNSYIKTKGTFFPKLKRRNK